MDNMNLQQPLNGPLEQEIPQENDVHVVGESPVSDHDVDPFMENLNRDPTVRPQARGPSENGVPIASVMISPGQERWNQVYENMSREMQMFMDKIASEPEENLFPFMIGSLTSSLPPFPSSDYLGNWYERLKSCNDVETHLEHVSYDHPYRGCERVIDNYYRLANKSVAVISQLQQYPGQSKQFGRY